MTPVQAHNSLQFQKIELLEILFFLLGSVTCFFSMRSAQNIKLYPENSRLWPLVPPLLELCHCTHDEHKICCLTVPVL